MELIDWAGLARNSLWVLGLSIVLATLSVTRWRARGQGVRLRSALGRSGVQAALSAGLLLFSASLAWGATRTWELLAWLALAVAFAWQLVAAALTLRKTGRSNSAEE